MCDPPSINNLTANPLLPQLPNISNIPNVPNIPSIPNIPNIPNVANMRNIPRLPSIPNGFSQQIQLQEIRRLKAENERLSQLNTSQQTEIKEIKT